MDIELRIKELKGYEAELMSRDVGSNDECEGVCQELDSIQAEILELQSKKSV